MPTTVQPAPPDQQPAFAPSLSQEVLPTSNPWDQDQEFKDLMKAKIFSCPGSNAGDYAFLAWLYDFYLGAKGGAAPPAAAPSITTLSPSTAPANADVTVDITGTGFDGGATVNIGTAYGLVPTSATATNLSVLIKAVNIAFPGTLPVSVKNGDSQYSAPLDFTVT
jgi:hypothetical protein